MEGFYSPYVPGWDCHGLPIEHKVDQKLGARKKDMTQHRGPRGVPANTPRNFSTCSGPISSAWAFSATGSKPYTTLDPAYEATVIRFFNSFVKKGNVYRKKRPVYWCISCRTALAEAEVEYHDHTSPSITVKFALTRVPAVAEGIRRQPDLRILIWTTTPWTIPANLAIAVHPDFDYALFEMNGELYIAAIRLLPAIAALNGDTFAKLQEFKGSGTGRTQRPPPAVSTAIRC